MFSTSTIDLPPTAIAALETYVATADRVASRAKWRKGQGAAYLEECGAAARRLLERGTCEHVQVVHDRPPATLFHEHGLIVLIEVDARRTQMLDFSGGTDDERWELYEAGGLARREWQWLRLEGIGSHSFTTSGDAIELLDLGELYGNELERYLTEGDAGWPGDDATLTLPFATALELAGRQV